MKLILSRKGFDTGFGGVPSPIVDGRPISFPIPTKQPTETVFADLRGEIYSQIPVLTNNKITATDYCHVDPDINESVLLRRSGWRGSLGQTSSSASHLRKQEVIPGDLFLFFGLFQNVIVANGKYKYSGPREHRIWGWLQIDEIINLGSDGSHALTNYPWLKGHPHVRPGWDNYNTLFLAKQSLELPGLSSNERGYGTFNNGLRLTAPGAQCSKWLLPDFFNPILGGTGLTYHKPDNWSHDGTVQRIGNGQEFVADITDNERAMIWIESLFSEGVR